MMWAATIPNIYVQLILHRLARVQLNILRFEYLHFNNQCKCNPYQLWQFLFKFFELQLLAMARAVKQTCKWIIIFYKLQQKYEPFLLQKNSFVTKDNTEGVP